MVNLWLNMVVYDNKAIGMGLADELKKSINAEGDAQSKRGRGVVMFIAQKDEIADALERGFNIKKIWQYLYNKNRMPIQYPTFANYVYRYITGVDAKAADGSKTTNSARKSNAAFVDKKDPVKHKSKSIDFNYSSGYERNQHLAD